MLKEEILKELRGRFAGNPLFRDEIFNTPRDFASVYHFTHEHCLDGIAREGLLPTLTVYEKNNKDYKSTLNYKVDKIFDEIAPQGFSRLNSVYAHDDYYFTPHLGNGNLILEVKIDPESALVVDAGHFIVARICFEKRGEVSGCEKKYWAGAMRLSDYQRLSLEEKTEKFRYPEILIPNKIAPEFIKVKGIFL
ncbi:MAG: hypothetical protein WC459_03230 [Patescibacteria group bacterium]